MLAFADVVHLLPHKFARLRTGRFAFLRVFAGAFHCLFLRHYAPPSFHHTSAEVATGSKGFCTVARLFAVSGR